MSYLYDNVYHLWLSYLFNKGFWNFVFLFVPYILAIELPFYVITTLTIFRFYLYEIFSVKKHLPFYPKVTCIVTAYNEGRDIIRTLHSLSEQLYKGTVEILIIIDGAEVNQHTVQAAQQFIKQFSSPKHRHIRIIAKQTRGGHASSLNIGIKLAKGEIIIILDGDCSCDNDMIANTVRSFNKENIVGMSGTLRVRNAQKNLLTRLQSIEYMLGIHLSRLGLAKLDILNNVSSAFGAFRKDFLLKIGGWKNGSAEDLDLTFRIQAFFKRHPGLKLTHNPYAVVHTDVPTTWRKLFKQRLRWDGDIFYIYFYRHWRSFRPKFLGWKAFIGLTWYVLLLHVILPFIIIFGVIFLLFSHPLEYLNLLMVITYIYYFSLILFLYTIYWLLVSERKKQDLKFLPYLLLMPIYHLIMRVWSGIAILFEILLHSHRDSTMGPWWVNRKIH